MLWGQHQWGYSKWGQASIDVQRTLAPLVGPTTGGTPFVLSGSYVASYLGDDTFAGSVINSSKWIVTTSGSGAVSQLNLLKTRTGATPGSRAGLSQIPTVYETDARVEIALWNRVTEYPPPSLVTLAAYELHIDNSNYARLLIRHNPLGTRTFARSEIVANGALQVSAELDLPTRYKSGQLRLLRIQNRVIMLVDDSVVLDDQKGLYFPTTVAHLRFYVDNESAAYVVGTGFGPHEVPTLVLFGENPARSTTRIRGTRVRGVTPPSQIATSVPIKFVTFGFTRFSVPDTVFAYSYPTELGVLQGPMNLSVVGDLRNPITSPVGFGG